MSYTDYTREQSQTSMTDQIEATVQSVFPERVYFRVRRTPDDEYLWEHLSASPAWITDIGIRREGNLLAQVRTDDTERMRLALHQVLSSPNTPVRMLVTFCAGNQQCTTVRMGLVQSSHDKNSIDGYLEPEELDTTLFSHPWLGPFLQRMDISYTLINRKFEIVDFNLRSDEYAQAALGRSLVIGESVLSYASPESKALLEHDLEQSFLGTEVHREWSEHEPATDDQVLSSMYIPFTDTAGQVPTVAMCTFDLTHLRRVEQHQRELAVAIERSPISVVITNPEGVMTYVNPFFEELTGYSAGEVVGQNPRLLQSETSRANNDYGDMWTMLSTGKSWTGEFINRKKNGEEYLEKAVLVPVTSGSGELTSIVGLKEDITEQRQTINQLVEREEHFRALFENAGEAIYIHDTAGYIRDANPMATVQTGYSNEELIGMHIGELEAEPQDGLPPEVTDLLETKAPKKAHHVTFETTQRRKDGSVFPTEVTLFLFSEQGERLKASAVLDATERKERMEQLRRSAEENALLLREVHHRVKNNLQRIASLLHLQLDLVSDSHAHMLFQENILRVLSMAAVHETLHENASLTEIDLNGYLKQLIHRLLDFAESQNKQVSIAVDGEPVMAGIDQVVPFGIIVSELILDAIHHTAEDETSREILITITGDTAHSELSIRDNGMVAPSGTILRDAKNDFRSTLIEALVQQVDGCLETIPDDSWYVRLSFVPTNCAHVT